jgi:tetratricopeptide (TPR) repeat protein
LIVCCALATRAAVAETPNEPNDRQAKARAQALLSEGTTAYGRGDYASALEKFTAAYKIFPSPKLWFNIGQANRDLGRPVEAVEAFDRFLTDAGDAPPETLAEARRSAAELKTKLGQLDVTCSIDGAEITIDGKQVGDAPLGGMVWTTPGRHQVAARQPGYSPVIEDVVTEAGKAISVNLDLRPVDLRPANQPGDAALVGGSAEPPPLYRRPWFWVGVGALIGAGVTLAVILARGSGSNEPETTLGAKRAF